MTPAELREQIPFLADVALIVFGEVAAHLTVAHLFFGVDDGGGERLRFALGHVDDAVGVPLRRFSADAGEFRKFVDEPPDRLDKYFHRYLKKQTPALPYPYGFPEKAVNARDFYNLSRKQNHSQ